MAEPEEFVDKVKRQARESLIHDLLQAGYDIGGISQVAGITIQQASDISSRHDFPIPDDEEMAEAYRRLELAAVHKAMFLLERMPQNEQAALVRAVLASVAKRSGQSATKDFENTAESLADLMKMMREVPTE